MPQCTVHYDTVPLAKAQDGHKDYWDSQKQALRQVFTTSNLVQNMILHHANIIKSSVI